MLLRGELTTFAHEQQAVGNVMLSWARSKLIGINVIATSLCMQMTGTLLPPQSKASRQKALPS